MWFKFDPMAFTNQPQNSPTLPSFHWFQFILTDKCHRIQLFSYRYFHIPCSLISNRVCPWVCVVSDGEMEVLVRVWGWECGWWVEGDLNGDECGWGLDQCVYVCVYVLSLDNHLKTGYNKDCLRLQTSESSIQLERRVSRLAVKTIYNSDFFIIVMCSFSIFQRVCQNSGKIRNHDETTV